MAKNVPIGVLDVGSQKVTMLVAEQRANGLAVLGVGTSVSRGMRAGCVVDVKKTSEAIGAALAEAELMAGCEIHKVAISVSGEHMKGINSHGVAAAVNREVSKASALRAIEGAKAVSLPKEMAVLQFLLRQFVLDGQSGILDPVGMEGVRLEAHLHVTSVVESVIRNLCKSCHAAGLSVTSQVPASLAAAEAVLTPEDKEMGVAVADIGAGTVDLVIYQAGTVAHTAVIPSAGHDVTRDLAHVLETSLVDAEGIKKRHGSAMASLVDEDFAVEVAGLPGRGIRQVRARHVAEVMEARLEEILDEVRQSIVRSSYGEMLTAGLVLTGGTALTRGITDLATRVLQMPARVGEPSGLEGLADEIDDASYATAVGLALGLPENPWQPGWSAATMVKRVIPEWVRRRWS